MCLLRVVLHSPAVSFRLCP